MMRLFAYIGVYSLCVRCTEIERKIERKKIGEALVRIDAGIGTYEDYELIEEVKNEGEKSIREKSRR